MFFVDKGWQGAAVARLRYILNLLDLTKWPADAPELDVALEKCADICHLDEKACVVVLYPVSYKGLSAETTIKRVRLFEDRIMAMNMCMDFQFNVNYDIPEEHGNERRPLSQMGRLLMSKKATNDGQSSPWLSTLMARGRLPHTAPLVRVKDMVTPGRGPSAKDKRLGPGDRVAQRGTYACEILLKGFLNGLVLESGDKIVVGNPLPLSVDEWGLAVWKCRCDPSLDVHYVAMGDTQELTAELCGELQKALMNEWWDSCVEAGPKDSVGCQPYLPCVLMACVFVESVCGVALE